MKIFEINSVCGIKSTGRIVSDLYDVFTRHGHECKVAYGRELPQIVPNEHVYRIGNESDVKHHALMSRITDKTGFYSKTATKLLITRIKNYNPDVIHLHNIHGYYINIEILFNYLREEKKKVIWTLHDCWPFTGHCAYFDFVGCEKWKTQCAECPQKKEYPQSVFLDNSKRNFQLKKQLFTGLDITLVTPSNWLKDMVKQSFLGEYDVVTINNGIDLSEFKPAISDFRKRNNLADKKIVLGVASIWDRRKGLKDFIKLSKMLDDKYKIVLVGLSDAQQKEIPKNILALSKTDSIRELAEIYTVADVFVNPTYEDNFPTTNIEALACGTPVITYKTGGSPEIIDENCGIVIEKGDINALRDSLDEAQKFTKEDCIKRSESFDKHKNYLKYLEILK